jgi:hypothetical protein
MPIYKVKTPTEEVLVDAKHPAQAISHVTRNTITTEVVSATEVVKLMQAGMKVEVATVETKPTA